MTDRTPDTPTPLSPSGTETTPDDFGYDVDVARFKDRPPAHIAEALLAARRHTAAGCHWALNVAAHLLAAPVPSGTTTREGLRRTGRMMTLTLPDHEMDALFWAARHAVRHDDHPPSEAQREWVESAFRRITSTVIEGATE